MSAYLHASCDRAVAQGAKCTATVGHPAGVLAVTILASSLAFIDGSVVNVGLPAIGASLKAGASELQWVINAYLLPLSALLLLGGAAGDRFGRRRYLNVGIAVFAVFSVVCAVAPDGNLLLLGRVMQGLGAALLLPNSLAILGQCFSGEAKGRAVGTWAAAGAIAGVIGPLLGGWLIDLGSWRAIFLINLPLAAGAMVLARWFVPPDPASHGEAVDVAGGLLATVGLGSLTWALTLGSGPTGWKAAALAGVGLASMALIGFVTLESRRGERAMMPLSLFATSPFVGLNLLTLFLYGALGALLVLVPYFLIEAGGYSAVAAAAALIPLPITLALLSPLAGSLAGRTGARALLASGPLVVAVGFILAVRIGVGSSYWTHVLPAILVISVGMAAAVAPLTTAVLSSVSASRTGVASGFNSAVARAGGLFATALLGSVFAAHGPALVTEFHTALIACGIGCLVASASALLVGRA
ncbi:MAG TPA: MFS transporter [Steroidobacteraceae bacterium]|nr:MFS transporter [Steroidobacteraceae bacterium]